jgi:hypothetical protein
MANNEKNNKKTMRRAMGNSRKFGRVLTHR